VLIELVDALRCPAPHAGGTLVAAVHARRGRRVWTATLGCPVCRASYPVERGVAWFGVEPGPGAAGPPPADPDETYRAAALLHLAEPGGLVLLEGAGWGALAESLFDVCAAHYVVLNAPFEPEGDDLSVVRAAGALPFAAGTFRAAAEDDAALVGPATSAAAGRARVVAPAHAALPPELSVLARDERHVVAERQPPASAPLTLRRAR
jgi:hypothetical protein